MRIYKPKDFQFVSIDLRSAFYMGERNIKCICNQIFVHFKNLKRLEIYFPDDMATKSQVLAKLAENMNKRFKRLVSLSIHFPNHVCHEIKSKRVLKLIEKASISPILKSLSIRFPWLADRGLGILSSYLHRRLSNLRSLSIDVTQSWWPPNERFKLVSAQFGPHLRNLAQLHRDFQDGQQLYSITDQMTRKLIHATISHYNSLCFKLKHLSLHFNGASKLTDDTIEQLMVALPRFTKLTSLSLDFNACDGISEQALQKLIMTISLSLKDLRQISLSFAVNPKVTDKTLDVISSNVCVNLRHLEHLSLSLASCVKVTGKGIKKFSASFNTNFSNMRSLSLDFSSCGKISNKAFKQLSLKIAQTMTKLEHLSLLFGSSLPDEWSLWESEIATSGLLELGSILAKHLSGLKELCLKLSNYRGITEKGVEDFCIGLSQNLRKLRRLSLNFAKCKKVSQMIERVKTPLKHIPEVEILLDL